MKHLSKYIAVAALFLTLSGTLCKAQPAAQEEKEYADAVAKQVEQMIEHFKLDDYQAFKLDTLMQHYAPIYQAEIKRVKDSGAAQVASFQTVVDKWADFFDSEYQKIFTEEQWKRYLKSPAGREKKKRDKRMAAARGEEIK
ncbi:MAG: hypothetical protein J6X89_08875 [Bacteroidales bacterium]|nr:hypothetical protein [Bacteroidales bacterium]